MLYQLIQSTALHIPLASESVQCVVTSPPYWGLRKYKGEQSFIWPAVSYAPMPGLPEQVVPEWRGELGLEPTPEMYTAHLVAIFREVWRVLRRDGVLWLNLGDSFASAWSNAGRRNLIGNPSRTHRRVAMGDGLKQKDLCAIPWRVALALQADGWWLRSDVIWSKPNPMPESVTDRPTKAHEYMFLLSKSERYYWDQEAVREANNSGPSNIKKMVEKRERIGGKHKALEDPLVGASGATNIGRKCAVGDPETGRNIRTVWTIATRPYKGAHFAVFPSSLVEPCIKAGTSARGCCPECGAPWERVVEHGKVTSTGGAYIRHKGNVGKLNLEGDKTMVAREKITLGWRPGCECGRDDTAPCIVLDPFAGSCTTGMVANQLGRYFVGLDVSRPYLHGQGKKRLRVNLPLPGFVE